MPLAFGTGAVILLMIQKAVFHRSWGAGRHV